MSWLGAVTTTVRVFGAGKSVARDALVDTGSTTLSVPQDVADELGLRPDLQKPVTSFGRVTMVPWASQVRIEVMGKSLTTDAIFAPAGSPLVLGLRQLEALGLNVYPREGVVR
jgi:predicted aspartyl protease